MKPRKESLRLRGLAAIALLGGQFLIADLVQRTVIVAWVKLRPSSRARVFSWWTKLITHGIMEIVQRIGGARIEISAKVPLEPGILVLMNHQSLLDIPVALKIFGGDYPRFVTLRRHSRGIPMVSYMLRLYKHPIVDPEQNVRRQLFSLREMAATSTRPVLIFPEGSRTQDGEIQRFKMGGMKAILSARPWSVHVVVGDGMWHAARLGDFVRNVSSIQSKVESVGPFTFDAKSDDVDAFISEMHRQMCDKLREMREARRAAATG